jgi:uncharacterized protein YabE (DUF348 family)
MPTFNDNHDISSVGIVITRMKLLYIVVGGLNFKFLHFGNGLMNTKFTVKFVVTSERMRTLKLKCHKSTGGKMNRS